jgi:hypothetical protein
MDPRTRNFVLLLAGTAAVPFIAQSAFATRENRDLAVDAANLGLVGTLVGVPLILLMVPRFNPIVTAVTLTALGFALKMYLLSHDTDEYDVELLTAAAAA